MNPEVADSNTSLGNRIDKLTRERKGKDTQTKLPSKVWPRQKVGISTSNDPPQLCPAGWGLVDSRCSQLDSED